MAFSTYAELQSTVADYLARSDLTSQIQDFIRLGEVRLRRDLRTKKMLKLVTTSTVANQSTVGLPADFLQMRDLHINTNPVSAVEYLSPSVFFRNSYATTTGLPTKYTVLSEEFQFAPIPDTNYTLEMLYYAAPPYLSNTNTSNVFLANYPDLLLYASLGEAEPFLMNDARLSTWAALYDKGINSVAASDDAGEYSGVPLTISIASR